MVRPSQETRIPPLTDSASLSAGDGTIVGDDGIDIDPGDVSPGGSPGPSIIHFEPAAAGTITPDYSDATVWDLTLVDDIDIANAIGWPASGLEGIIKLIIRQDSTGGWVISSWGTAYEFPDTDGTDGGAEPTIHSAAESITVLYLQAENGGTSVGVSSDGAGSAAEEDFVPHGSMGTTEAFDPADGNSHYGTLDDDCTATIAAPSGDGPIQMEWWITGDGAHDLTIAATGGTVIGDTPPASVDGETYRLVLDRIPGSTNDWIVNLVGGESTTTTTAGIGPLLLASDHATPIVFDDILQASDGHDFLYASEA